MTSEEIKQQEDIGTILKEARLERGEDLAHVSNNLRIRQVYLEALENNQFNLLPGRIYIVGFIRSYSEYLDLNADEILGKYKNLSDHVNTKQDLKFPVFVPENGLPGGAVVIIGLIIVFVGYASWYFLSNQKKFAINQVPQVPTEIQALSKNQKNKEKTSNIVSNSINQTKNEIEKNLPKQIKEKKNNEETVLKTDKPIKKDDSPVNISKELSINSASKPSRNILESESLIRENTGSVEKAELIDSSKTKIIKPKIDKLPKKEIGTAEPDKKTGTPQIAEKPQIVPDAKPAEGLPELEEKIVNDKKKENLEVNKADNEPKKPTVELLVAKPIKNEPSGPNTSRISIVAITDSYIQVRDNNNSRLLITRLLKKNQRYEVPNRSNLSLITGNAGALQIFVDGTLAPSIGPIGKVRRNVILDADKLMDGKAVLE